jgi:hypothetical protein
MLNQQLLRNIESLPPDLQKEVGDFVDFLRQKYPSPKSKSQRTVGEYRQQIVMPDDFNQALDDDFWLGN